MQYTVQYTILSYIIIFTNIFVFKRQSQLTLIRMARGAYDSQNFEEILLKMTWSKVFFILDLFLTKYFIIISC